MSTVSESLGYWRTFDRYLTFHERGSSLETRVYDVARTRLLFTLYTPFPEEARELSTVPGGLCFLVNPVFLSNEGHSPLSFLQTVINHEGGWAAVFSKKPRASQTKQACGCIAKKNYKAALRFYTSAFGHGDRWIHFLRCSAQDQERLVCLYLVQYLLHEGALQKGIKLIKSYRTDRYNSIPAGLTKGIRKIELALQVTQRDWLAGILYRQILAEYPEQFEFYVRLAKTLIREEEKVHVLLKGADYALEIHEYAHAIDLATRALSAIHRPCPNQLAARHIIETAASAPDTIYDKKACFTKLVMSYCQEGEIERAHCLFKEAIKAFTEQAYRKKLVQIMREWELDQPYFGPAKWRHYCPQLKTPYEIVAQNMAREMQLLEHWELTYLILYIPCVSLEELSSLVSITDKSNQLEADWRAKPKAPYWVLMTKTTLIKSRDKSLEEQVALLEKRAHMPTVLEVVIAHLSQRVQCRALPYFQEVAEADVYTRCAPMIDKTRCCVRSTDDGVEVIADPGYADMDFGVGACWKI